MFLYVLVALLPSSLFMKNPNSEAQRKSDANANRTEERMAEDKKREAPHETDAERETAREAQR